MDWLRGPFEKLFERPVGLLYLLGALSLVAAAVGGIPYNDWVILDFNKQVALAVVGAALLLFGRFSPSSEHSSENSATLEACKFRITQPKDGDLISGRSTVIRGSFAKEPPPGYVVQLFRIYPKNQKFYPMGGVDLNTAKKEWEAAGCDLGRHEGQPRIIGLYLVGPSGRVLLDYFREAEKSHGDELVKLKPDAKSAGPFLPLLKDKTTDMFKCEHIKVERPS